MAASAGLKKGHGDSHVNSDLVGDGTGPMQPGIVVRVQEWAMQFTGVEYIVIAEAWDANNDTPPVFMDSFCSSPAAPTATTSPHLRVARWAWNNNPLGMFADWNPRVSCGSYTAEDAPHGASH
jgi:hypothetical protein